MDNEILENKTFDEIQIGDNATITRELSIEDIHLFALVTGDTNPTHIDHEYMDKAGFNKVSGHSMWGGSLVSSLLGNQLPGSGTVYKSQDLKFERPISLGDALTVTIKAIDKNPETKVIKFDCQCINQHGEAVYAGVAEVHAPTEKVQARKVTLPSVHMDKPGAQLQRLIAMTKDLQPIRMAVVHPVDHNSLLGAIDAAKINLIVPVLIGPRKKIEAAAEIDNVDLTPYELIDTEHSHEAAAQAVALARSGNVQGILKGSLHTDELMSEVVNRGTGVSTARRMSHVFLMDVPTYARPLMITDAAINIDPSLETKRDIVQNAIELAQALGNEEPHVALLSAVETINSKMRSTLEAAAICKMAHRKQIVGGVVDGPLAFDNAVSEEAARIKGIESPVAGRADILVAPDLEAGNMVAKQLEYLAEAQSSGIVLGARVPIALTSRADTVLSRMASCALALLLSRHQSKMP